MNVVRVASSVLLLIGENEKWDENTDFVFVIFSANKVFFFQLFFVGLRHFKIFYLLKCHFTFNLN